MTETQVSYTPGPGTLLAHEGRYLLIDATPTEATVSRLWAGLSSAPSGPELLTIVTDELPAAGYCLVEVGDQVEVARRDVRTTFDGRAVDLGGPTATAPPLVNRIVAALASSAREAQFPLTSGVVAASALTVLRDLSEVDVAGLLAALPAPTGAARTPSNEPAPLGHLLLEDGTAIELDRRIVLGRAPRVPEGAADQPRLVSLAAYGRDVSRQHLEVVLQDGAAFVRDLGSANGTQVHDPFGRTTELEPGTATPLQPGSRIEVAEVTTVYYRPA
ncbi:MAG: FHA domain-containing protein [Propionibacteriales bacterium]|nr:FHA domain-containing protein [Propionibacteriales bacterium]